MIHRIVLFLKFAPVFGRLFNRTFMDIDLIEPLWNRKKHKTSVDGQTSQKSADLNALIEPNFYYRRFEPEGSRLPRLRSGLFYSSSSSLNSFNFWSIAVVSISSE